MARSKVAGQVLVGPGDGTEVSVGVETSEGQVPQYASKASPRVQKSKPHLGATVPKSDFPNGFPAAI